tara:strand:- start:19967 stop:20143 length:177 start_codon:yes stop_codon:yes gene_type:complete
MFLAAKKKPSISIKIKKAKMKKNILYEDTAFISYICTLAAEKPIFLRKSKNKYRIDEK